MGIDCARNRARVTADMECKLIWPTSAGTTGIIALGSRHIGNDG
jgi:hypothetical protein